MQALWLKIPAVLPLDRQNRLHEQAPCDLLSVEPSDEYGPSQHLTGQGKIQKMVRHVHTHACSALSDSL